MIIQVTVSLYPGNTAFYSKEMDEATVEVKASGGAALVKAGYGIGTTVEELVTAMVAKANEKPAEAEPESE